MELSDRLFIHPLRQLHLTLDAHYVKPAPTTNGDCFEVVDIESYSTPGTDTDYLPTAG
jgi:hypothetical protein